MIHIAGFGSVRVLLSVMSLENTELRCVSPAWDVVSSPGDDDDVFSRRNGVIITLVYPALHLEDLHRLLQALWV